MTSLGLNNCHSMKKFYLIFSFSQIVRECFFSIKQTEIFSFFKANFQIYSTQWINHRVDMLFTASQGDNILIGTNHQHQVCTFPNGFDHQITISIDKVVKPYVFDYNFLCGRVIVTQHFYTVLAIPILHIGGPFL